MSSLTTAIYKKASGRKSSVMILIPLFLFYFFIRCKVPYSVEKFHTVKYLKNFNEKISMKFHISTRK